jgi:DNA-binding transcriptional MerR regulator
VARNKIPDKLYFKIGEVADLVGVEAYVLRFWESEFPTFSPKKTSSGHRVYRRKDVETVLQIKKLLYEKGYTIAGARKRLGTRRAGALEERTEDTLERIRDELEDILTLLDGDT